MNKVGIEALIDLDKAECPCCSRPFEYEVFPHTVRYSCVFCNVGCVTMIKDSRTEAKQQAKKDLITTLLQRLGAIKIEFVSLDPIKLQPTDFGG